MAGDGAEIRELNPKQEGTVAHIEDRWTGISPQRAGLARENKKLNQQTIQRVAETEVEILLPVLEQAAVAAEEGRQVRGMAAFAGDTELERKIDAVLRRLATAAEPRIATTCR